MAWLQQVVYRRLGDHPEWDPDVFARLPGEFHESAQRNVAARREFRAMATKISDTLPAWRIAAPVPSDELLGYYREAESAMGVPWPYLAAINLVETRMGRLRGISTAGARGPMQFLPSTWAEVGRGDIDDPEDAIDAAARYLARRGGRTDIARGVHGYNPSDSYVRAVLAYARVLQREPAQYAGFYHWQVYYRMATGDVVLLEGYPGR